MGQGRFAQLWGHRDHLRGALLWHLPRQVGGTRPLWAAGAGRPPARRRDGGVGGGAGRREAGAHPEGVGGRGAPTWRGASPGTCTHQGPRGTAGRGRLASFWVPEATLANEVSATCPGSAPLYPGLGDLTGCAPPCGPIGIPCLAPSHPSSTSSLRPRKGEGGGEAELGGERDQSLSRLSTTGEEAQPPGHLRSLRCSCLRTGMALLSTSLQVPRDSWPLSLVLPLVSAPPRRLDTEQGSCDHLNCEAHPSFSRWVWSAWELVRAEGADSTLASSPPSALQRTQLPRPEVSILGQLAAQVSPAPTETTIQLPEHRAGGLRGSDQRPVPNGCLLVPSFASEMAVLTLGSFLFCFVLWQYEVGDGNLILINGVFRQPKLTLFRQGVFKLEDSAAKNMSCKYTPRMHNGPHWRVSRATVCVINQLEAN